MKTLIVGGTFDSEGKASKIVETMAFNLNADVVNGGTLEDLKKATGKIVQNDLVIWMPNVDNQEEKIYFKKRIGSTLIISKRIDIGNNRSEIDAVSRIFKFGANAVITIRDKNWAPEDPIGGRTSYVFKLIDALGNIWVDETKDIKDIIIGIYRLNMWTKDSERKPLVTTKNIPSFDSLQKFIDLNKQVAEKCQKAFGERFFGNLSTRCASMFPSMREKDYFLFSARNTDKEFLTISDMIFVDRHGNYGGNRKPSVDTPVQLRLYEYYTDINFIIHGHAYIKNALYTKEYFPCGDLREVKSIIDILMKNSKTNVLNLKNHGFIIMTTSLYHLEAIIETSKFETKGIESLNVGFVNNTVKL